MSKFVIPVSEKKRRKDLIWACGMIVTSLLCLMMLSYYLLSGEELNGIRKSLYIFFAINTGWSAVEYLRKRKRKEFFLEIDEYYLKWVMTVTGNPIITKWNEIRLIKKEEPDGILIFRDSNSFSESFSLKDFQEEEQEQIVSLLLQYASQKQIHLINFSERSLALA